MPAECPLCGLPLPSFALGESTCQAGHTLFYLPRKPLAERLSVAAAPALVLFAVCLVAALAAGADPLFAFNPLVGGLCVWVYLGEGAPCL